MKWFWYLLVFIKIFIPQNKDVEAVFTRKVCTEAERNERAASSRFNNIHEEESQKHSWSGWSFWSECSNGRRTRRRECLEHRVCGKMQSIQTMRCEEESSLDLIGGRTQSKKISHEYYYDNTARISRRQLEVVNDMQTLYRGFSSWSGWSPCSHTCLTVRTRYCVNPNYCHRRVIRQSAYCYTEGTYCHHWIRARMRRRKDPGRQGNELVEWMPTPPRAIHASDSYKPSVPPECGKLGHYRSLSDMLRIIGGRPAPPGKWPWQVAVLNKYKEAFCGGTLVALRWVTTAAHCVRSVLYVRLGEHDLLRRGRGEVEMRVREAVIHPLYDPDTVVNDIALLRLPDSASMELGHGLACLPKPSERLVPHTTCVILGWGKRRATDVHGSRILQEAQIMTVSEGVCRRSYWQYAITQHMVCAGRGRRDSCGGDSGGPLLCRNHSDMKYYLQGITSFGDGCGKRGKFGIYTRTAGYVPWMYSVMNDTYFD